jgi:peptidoglycan-associated lipoprotein
MHKTLKAATILMALLAALILLWSCSKNKTASEASDVSVQETDLEAQKIREQLAQEQQEREAKKRELRAEKIKFMYEDVYFEEGSYRLMPEAKELLQHKALWLKKNSDIKVIIEGHTDEAGNKEHNIALGDQRAGAVKSFLIGQGIMSSRLIAVSYGKEQPIDNSRSEAARARNRRVHFVVEE